MQGLPVLKAQPRKAVQIYVRQFLWKQILEKVTVQRCVTVLDSSVSIYN